MTCRICEAPTEEILDLGSSPLANALKFSPEEVQESYPLVLEWCERCDNVQLRDVVPADELYSNYLYVTPDSPSLQAHYDALVEYLVGGGYVSSESFVVEAGSNIGSFLHRLAPTVGDVLGVDPARAIVDLANERGVNTICDYFAPEMASRIASERGRADLVVARHCLAHNESPHQMLDAAQAVLSRDGCMLIENAYVLNTIQNTEFDQVYHEHMFYFSVRSMTALLRMHDLQLVDAFTVPIHGGSIVFIARPGNDHVPSQAVGRISSEERRVLNRDAFQSFASRTRDVQIQLKDLIGELVSGGATIYSYGATAKGNTLLNVVGLSSQEISLCVDSTPVKQGRFLPGSNIPVISEEQGLRSPPDYYLLTAWNYKDEIVAKVRGSGETHSRFIIPVPVPIVLDS